MTAARFEVRFKVPRWRVVAASAVVSIVRAAVWCGLRLTPQDLETLAGTLATFCARGDSIVKRRRRRAWFR